MGVWSIFFMGGNWRQKIRVRKYENSGTAFLEIKGKEQQGAHMAKKRIEWWSGGDDVGYAEFIGSTSAYKLATFPKVGKPFPANNPQSTAR